MDALEEMTRKKYLGAIEKESTANLKTIYDLVTTPGAVEKIEANKGLLKTFL